MNAQAGGGSADDFSDSNGFEAFKGDIDAVERRVASEIDPGARAMVVAILVFVLLLTLVLPHTGGAKGVDVLIGSDAAVDNGITLPLRVFAWISLVFGVGFSMLALLTRRWTLAWIALAGSTVASFLGLLAVWSRQTAPEPYPGPGIGLIVAWLAVIGLSYHWARVVARRTALQLAAEDHRRQVIAEGQRKGFLETFTDEPGPAKPDDDPPA
jgi:hypothetical protein